jgi:NAD(P)-dependent dehydrogenase (short-subunit alcohol dehydrogenase family)
MQIEGQIALVTGANRGLGRHLAKQLRDRGATVYAAARNPAAVDLDGVKPIALDVTDPASIAAAAETTGDVSILVNNAGSATNASLLTGDLADIRLEIDTHYLGTLAVTRAFAPQLGAHDSSAVLNILSVASWINFADFGAYSAAKSAAWSMTNGLRQELAPQGTRVSALHVGYMDTDMTTGLDAPKADPADVARVALDGVAADTPEIIADETSKTVLAALSGGIGALYPQFGTRSAAPAYVVVNFDVLDEEAGAAYAAVAQQSIRDHGGHYLVGGPTPQPVEGTWDSSGFVVIEFPDMDRIREWYDSAEYRRAREIRKGKARVTMMFAEGAPPEGLSRPA